MNQANVDQAVNFLRDPKVQSAPLTKRIAFLESKGLSQGEIQHALSLVNGGDTSSSTPVNNNTTTNTPPTYQQQQQQPPVVYQQPQAQPMDWKDYTLGSMAVVGFGYLAMTGIQKYVLPLISWPNSKQLESSTKQIDLQLDASKSTLEAVKLTTTDMMKAIKVQSEEVNKSLTSLEDLLVDLRENDMKRSNEMKSLKNEVDLIKELIPKMMDKSKDSQTAVLTDLQSEIKSLKSLLLNNRRGNSKGGGSGNSGSTSGNEGVGERSSSPSRLVPKPSIPAWQLEGGGSQSSTASDQVSNTNEE